MIALALRHTVYPARGTVSRYLPPVLWMAIIFVLSAVPGNRYPRLDIPNLDKGMHFLLFLPLGWLLARAATAPGEWRVSARGAFAALLAACAYGAVDEIHQFWVPFRTPSVADWAVDCAAACTGLVTYVAIGRATQVVGRGVARPPEENAEA